MDRRHRRLALGASLLLVAVVLAAIGWHAAVARLQRALEQSLGPNSHVGTLLVSWNGVEARDVRIAATPGSRWPAADELRARRVLVVPALASLWRSGWQVHRIRVEGAYVSALRTRDGRLRLLPALLEHTPQPHAAGRSGAPAADIGVVEFTEGVLELFDASVRQPAHRLRLEQLAGHAGPLHLPQLDAPIGVAIDGVLKGVQHDGRLRVDGRVTPATRDAALQARFDDVDLLALQPYLLRVAEGGVRRGRLDLSLQANVTHNQLKAPGTLVLKQLELNSGSGLASIAGVPRQAVLAGLQRNGRIDVRFTLEGRLDDPSFSLNENLATRLASGLAQSVGVSLGGVVEGVGNAVKSLFGK